MQEELKKACEGKSKSAGGLNLPEFRQTLITLLPKLSSEITKAKRAAIQELCKQIILEPTTKFSPKLPAKVSSKNITTAEPKSKWEYKIIPKGTILYRGTQSPRKLGTGPWWFTPEETVAEMFADSRGSAGERVIKEFGYVDKYEVISPLRLLRLDDRNNLIEIGKDPFLVKKGGKRTPEQYEVLEGLGNMIVLLEEGEQVWILPETKPENLRSAKMYRSSTNPGDYDASKWLCSLGFDGIYTGPDILPYEAIKYQITGDYFPEEVILCDPENKVRNIGSKKVKIHY